MYTSFASVCVYRFMYVSKSIFRYNFYSLNKIFVIIS